MFGMQRCSDEIDPSPDFLLVDGNRYPVTNIQGQAVVKGDCLSKSIARLRFLRK